MLDLDQIEAEARALAPIDPQTAEKLLALCARVRAAKKAIDAAEENARLAKRFAQKGEAGSAGFYATHVLYSLAHARAAFGGE